MKKGRLRPNSPRNSCKVHLSVISPARVGPGLFLSEENMKKSLLILAMIGGVSASNALVWNLTAAMDAAQHGHVNELGIGFFTGQYDDVTNTFTVFTMGADYLTGPVTVSHVHLGAIGVNGGVLVNFGALGSWSGAPTATYTPNGNTATINEADEAALLSNGTYINLHTATYPGGEIRGQVQAQAVPEPFTLTMLGLGAAALVSRKRRA